MLTALLLIIGVDLAVILAFLAALVARKRWVRRQPGAFRGAIRVAHGGIGGRRCTWRHGYGRWVRNVLVWSRAPFLLGTQLLAVDELAKVRTADPSEVKRLGDHPAVVQLISGATTIDLAASGDHRDLLRGPFGRSGVDRGRTTRPG